MEERLKQIYTELSDIKNSQKQILSALLGDVEKKDVPGLIEESRTLKKDVVEIKEKIGSHESQIQDLHKFRLSIKQMVAGVAVAIPIGFEIFKIALTSIFRTKN